MLFRKIFFIFMLPILTAFTTPAHANFYSLCGRILRLAGWGAPIFKFNFSLSTESAEFLQSLSWKEEPNAKNYGRSYVGMQTYRFIKGGEVTISIVLREDRFVSVNLRSEDYQTEEIIRDVIRKHPAVKSGLLEIYHHNLFQIHNDHDPGRNQALLTAAIAAHQALNKEGKRLLTANAVPPIEMSTDTKVFNDDDENQKNNPYAPPLTQ